jgi:predicted secreted hydrolase
MNYRRVFLIPVLVAWLMVETGFSAAQEVLSPGEFEHARLDRVLQFPRDHGAHPTFRTEWWYYTGHLWPVGEKPFTSHFGFQLTFFRSAIAPLRKDSQSDWRQIFFAHSAITDSKRKQYFHDRRYTRGGMGIAGAALDSLSLWNHTWSATGSGALQTLTFSVDGKKEESGYDVELIADGATGILLHGQRGFSKKGTCKTCASHYYSFPRLPLRGTVHYAGRTLSVEGVGWMDHEFMSSALEGYQVGWDWLSLIFRDKGELMIARVRSRTGDRDYLFGTYREGSTVHYLDQKDIIFEVLDTWKSAKSSARYPISQRIVVPSLKINEIIKPTFSDQEQFSEEDTENSYWEGAVVTDDNDAIGFLELTGYGEEIGGKL